MAKETEDEELEDRVERWRTRALKAEDRLQAIKNLLVDLLEDTFQFKHGED